MKRKVKNMVPKVLIEKQNQIYSDEITEKKQNETQRSNFMISDQLINSYRVNKKKSRYQPEYIDLNMMKDYYSIDRLASNLDRNTKAFASSNEQLATEQLDKSYVDYDVNKRHSNMQFISIQKEEKGIFDPPQF